MSINTKCSNCGKEYTLADELLGRKAKCKECGEEFVISDSSLEVKKEKVTWEKSPDLELKPEKISFIVFSNPLIVILSVIALIGSLFSTYALGLFAIVLLLFIWENIKWKKEKYTLTDRKIIFDNGSLISDNSTEINLDKITEVKASLPFLQHLIFKTGNLYIKTAGAGTAQVRLSNIKNTMEVYEEFRVRMQKNGFHLKKEKLVQSEKPHMIGIVGEVFGKLIGILFFGFYLFISLLSEGDNLGEIPFLVTLVPIFILAIAIFFITITILDLKRRKYEIFTDSIWYHEGFLNKHYAFIPMEVVADVENSQSFFSKVFGLHDIIISSAGTSNKVVFKNMVNGETMIKNIRYLKDHITMSEKDAIEGEVKSVNSLIGFKDKIEEPLDFDKEFEGHYKANIAKTIFEIAPAFIFFIPLLFIGIEEFLSTIPVLLVIISGRIIRLIFTDYNIRKTTIEKKFELFSTKFSSFNIEKITGVQFKESFIDKWFGTMTVKFWSIGSGTPMTFENIKKTPGLEEKILAKVGIRKEEKRSDIVIDFNFINFIKANIIIHGLLIIYIFLIIVLNILGFNDIGNYLLGFVGMFVIPYLFIFIYKKIFFAEKRYLREIYKNYIKTQNGIFFITRKYVLFRHIKGVKSTKFPLTNTGNLWLNVAGEVVVEAKTQGQVLSRWTKGNSTGIFSNSVDMKYIKEVFSEHNDFDEILNGEKLDTTKILEAKQDIINTILPMIILIIPIIFIPLAIWIIKVKYWILENNRIVFGHGIFYKKRQTILYHRFNFIDLKRGFLNKIFKNGSVNIYTIGSSSVDMNIPNIDNYLEVYEKLKKD